MNWSFPQGPFRGTWQAKVLARRPLILPRRAYTYPREAEEIERGALELLVRPGGGEADFLATCALGFADPVAPTGVWAHPDPDTLCAVAGGYAYLINTRLPERFEQVSYRPVLAVHAVVAPVALLLFVGSRSIVAYGAGGQVWESAWLSDEGVTVTRITGAIVEGLGWELQADREIAFALDAGTGLRR